MEETPRVEAGGFRGPRRRQRPLRVVSPSLRPAEKEEEEEEEEDEVVVVDRGMEEYTCYPCRRGV